MKYKIAEDLQLVSNYLNITLEELAERIGLAHETISRIISNKINPSEEVLEKIYSFFYESGTNLNLLKEKVYRKHKNVVVFHGSKTFIEGDISLDHSRDRLDFGKGFYAGETFEQSLDFVCDKDDSSIYILEADFNELNVKTFDVSIEWMLYISMCRGLLDDFKDTKLFKEMEDDLSKFDIIIAPIADNRMFDTIRSFASAAITSEMAINALKGFMFGNQVVFKTKKAIQGIKTLEPLYVCKKEKRNALLKKIDRISKTNNYVTEQYRKYAGEGTYVSKLFL